MKNEMNRGAPRLRERNTLRGDTKSLLRSRPLQGILAAVAVLQGVSVASGGREYDRWDALTGDRASAFTTAGPVAQSLAPAVVAKPVKGATQIGDLELVKVARADEKKAETSAKSEAEVLAEKYRRKGFKVPTSLAQQIHEAALKNDIDPEIAFGLVKTESGFEDAATSHVGAIGLTQLMPATARWLKPGVTRSQLRDSETNLSIGFRYLRDLIEKYDGNTDLALTAYNRGPGTVDRALRRGRDPDNGYAGMVRGLRNSHK